MGHSNIAIFIPHRGCPHRCSFCDQKSISGEQKNVSPLDVRRELSEAFCRPLDKNATEIAFFGGSFTCLPRGEMEAFLQEAVPYLQKGMASGIRISTRPDGIAEDILDILKRYGVRSIELGAQSMDDTVLRLNQRGHMAADVKKASLLIRQYGFSLGLQMMVGLYGDGKESLYRTVEKIVALKPDTVRVYPTVVMRGTELDRLRREGLYTPLSLEQAVEWTAPLLKQFEDAGIRVIRVGLHPSKELEQNRTGGPYHPAFRELCEGFLRRQRLEEELKAFPKGSSLVVKVPKKELSKTIGQKKSNLIWAQSWGYRLAVQEDSALRLGEMKVTNDIAGGAPLGKDTVANAIESIRDTGI